MKDRTVCRKVLRGFTLLEVLISVFILAVVLTAVYSAYTGNLESIQRARESGDVNQTARIVLDRMCRDLESAVSNLPVPSGDIQLGMIAVNETREGVATDRIDFTSLSHLEVGKGGPESDLCEIGYYLDEPLEGSSREKGFVLFRRDEPVPDNDVTKGGEPLPLAEGVVSLKLSFEDASETRTDAWSTVESGGKLPALIRIELTILDGTGREHLFVTSVHPVLSGAGVAGARETGGKESGAKETESKEAGANRTGSGGRP